MQACLKAATQAPPSQALASGFRRRLLLRRSQLGPTFVLRLGYCQHHFLTMPPVSVHAQSPSLHYIRKHRDTSKASAALCLVFFKKKYKKIKEGKKININMCMDMNVWTTPSNRGAHVGRRREKKRRKGKGRKKATKKKGGQLSVNVQSRHRGKGNGSKNGRNARERQRFGLHCTAHTANALPSRAVPYLQTQALKTKARCPLRQLSLRTAAWRPAPSPPLAESRPSQKDHPSSCR